GAGPLLPACSGRDARTPFVGTDARGLGTASTRAPRRAGRSRSLRRRLTNTGIWHGPCAGQVSTRPDATPTLRVQEGRGGRSTAVRAVHPPAPGGSGAPPERAGTAFRSGGGQRAPHREGAAEPVAPEPGEAGRRHGDLPPLAVRGLRGSELLP